MNQEHTGAKYANLLSRTTAETYCDQVYHKSDRDEAICVINKVDRGFKVGITFEFDNYFHWSQDRHVLAMQPDVYLEFLRFLEDLVNWISVRRSQQTVQGIIVAYGCLSPNLTEAEVFDSPSRTARLCNAFYHLGKEAHTTLWALVKRFLVGYVICVRGESRLLYSDRLHVYGKDRSYTTVCFHDLLLDFKAVCNTHAKDPIWVHKCTAEGLFDVFDPELIRHALEMQDLPLDLLIIAALHAISKGEEMTLQMHPPTCFILVQDYVLQRGTKKGLATKTLAAVKSKVAKVSVKVESMVEVEKENVRASEMEGTRKKRCSEDWDMVAAGLTLSPRKHQKLYQIFLTVA
ncbi:hypothetical protein K438DRAFT_2170629 [Mycena galopus ATCC 62051]|nr:hypothetical protein K438DRAFT_2170629 [Mycena galopus ATCC 62051]